MGELFKYFLMSYTFYSILLVHYALYQVICFQVIWLYAPFHAYFSMFVYVEFLMPHIRVYLIRGEVSLGQCSRYSFYFKERFFS